MTKPDISHPTTFLYLDESQLIETNRNYKMNDFDALNAKNDAEESIQEIMKP